LTGIPPLRESARLTAAVHSALDASDLRECAAASVIDLRSHERGGWRADEDIYPASVIKIALMTEAHVRFTSGELASDQRVAIDAANLTATAEHTPLVPGYQARLDELVELMIERSDNVATNQLIDVLRRERVTATMHALGVEGFALGRKLSGADPLIADPKMTGRNSLRPSAAAHLLRLIALDQVPGAADQRALLARCMHGE
jgi:beta-lactamase class A